MVMINYKYFVIYSYHDLFVDEFDNEFDCMNFVKKLINEYKLDRDFHYKIIKGFVIDRKGF